MKEIKIPCEVCQDLIPLVQDGAASQESVRLVREHVQECASCKAMLEEGYCPPPAIEDKKVLQGMRRELTGMGMLLVAGGILMGILFTYSAQMFHNFLLMPAVGGVGYLVFRKKGRWLPLAVLGISYLWLVFQEIWEQGGITVGAVISPLFFALIYAGLTALGVLIAALLVFAFGKEES